MKKQILEEIKDMRYLLNYNRGKVISEQINEEEDFVNIDDFELSIDINITSFSSNDDDETDEEEADEYIKNMVNYGDFNDQSYEFEEDEIK